MGTGPGSLRLSRPPASEPRLYKSGVAKLMQTVQPFDAFEVPLYAFSLDLRARIVIMLCSMGRDP